MTLKTLRPQNYLDPRDAKLFSPFHDRARRRDPNWIYEVARVVLTPIAWFPFRTTAMGMDRVPAEGPVILAPNHNSNMDHFFCGLFLRRKIRFMAKSQLFGNRAFDHILRWGCVFPVRRGHRDEAAFTTARTVLARGGCVLMYCEGGRSRDGRPGDPKPGLGRLALESGAPVVPIAIQGSERVREAKRLRFPKVRLAYGEPIRFDPDPAASRDAHLEASREIFRRVLEMRENLGPASTAASKDAPALPPRRA